MEVSIDIPVYQGSGIRVFWEENSIANLTADADSVTVCGTNAAFMSFAKQMLYFSYNLLPNGAHVHFDSFFCKSNLTGLSLLMELRPDTAETDMCGFDDMSHPVVFTIPENPNETIWHSGSVVYVTYDKDDICISGNRLAFFSIAKKLLSLCLFGNNDSTSAAYDYPHGMNGWNGPVIRFQMQCTEDVSV